MPMLRSTDTTYKELKLAGATVVGESLLGTDTTYKELKHATSGIDIYLILVLILPIRN